MSDSTSKPDDVAPSADETPSTPASEQSAAGDAAPFTAPGAQPEATAPAQSSSEAEQPGAEPAATESAATGSAATEPAPAANPTAEAPVSAAATPAAETPPAETPAAPAAPVAPSGSAPANPSSYAAPTGPAIHQPPPAPQYAGQQPYPGQYPHPGHQPTAAYPTTPLGAPAPGAQAAAPGTTGAPAEKKKRSVAVPVIAALAVGAVLGGASGAGVTALVQSGSASQQQSSSGTNQPITINTTDNVNAVTAIAKKASPSVVTIDVKTSQEEVGGSGVILSDDGYVLTNNHVVTLDGASSGGQIEVTTADGKLYKAKVVGTDPIVDLAVIKLQDASGLTPIEFDDSSKLNVGDRVVAIGAPLGLSGTVTDGIVSALNRSIQIASSAVPDNGSQNQDNNNGSAPFNFWDFGNGQSQQNQSQQSQQQSSISLPVIQTDAAINHGNSGGALVDDAGKLIGINVAIASSGGSADDQSGSIGVGFAIPSNLAKRISDEIIKTGHGSHGLLGASVTDATADNSSTVGALVADVTSGGAAASAGLQKGDVVTGFNGLPITSSTDLTAQVRALAPDTKASLTYVRDGKSSTVEVTLGTLKS
jgi:putative serine protease PepD